MVERLTRQHCRAFLRLPLCIFRWAWCSVGSAAANARSEKGEMGVNCILAVEGSVSCCLLIERRLQAVEEMLTKRYS